MEKKIGIIGLWHLGCVLSASWSRIGYKVSGFDYDKERVAKLKLGKAPIFEPGLDESLGQGIAAGKLSFSDDISILSESDFIFLSYDTPVSDQDISDTSLLTKSVTDTVKIMKNGAILIVSSQSPVGFCKELRDLMKSVNPTVDIAYSPENLRLGEAIDCYLNPGRIILGTESPDTQLSCENLFASLNAEVISMGLESAEMVKHGINSFLAASIVFANSLADICELKGADIKDVVKGMKTDPRIGQKAYLAPGIGFSGGTLGRDLKVLETENNSANGYAKLFGFIHSNNFERKHAIIDKIEKIIGKVDGKEVGILGLTYKPGTSTLRRSLPLEIVDLLLAKHVKVKVFDPKADYNELSQKPAFTISKSIEEAAENVDILVLLTDWPEFKEFDWSKIKGKAKGNSFFDTRNFIPADNVQKSGLKYFTIGKKI